MAGAGTKREREASASGKAADDKEAAEVVVRGAEAARKAADRHESAAALKRKTAADRKTADEEEAAAALERKAATNRKAADEQEAAAAFERKAAADRKAADEREAAAAMDCNAAAARKAADEQEAAAALERKAAADRKAADDQVAAAALEHKAAADRKAADELEAAEALELEAAAELQAAEEEKAAAVHPQRSVADDAAAAEFSAAARKAGQTVWSGAPRAPPAVPDGSAWHPQADGGPQSELPGFRYGASSDATAAPSPPAPPHAAAGNDLPVGGGAGAAARANPPAVPVIAPVSETPGNNWARLFAYVGAVFDATPRYQLISVLGKADMWPYYLINFAAGRSVHSSPATRRGLEPWFLDLLRDALPAGINGEIRQVGPFLISNLLTVIHLLNAKFNHELPDSAAPDATVVARLGVPMSSPCAVPGAASVKSASTVTPSSARQVAPPPSTPAAFTLKRGGGGIAAARSPRKSVHQGSGAKKEAVVSKVYPNKRDPTWRRMMVAARILIEEYDADQDTWSDVDNIRPDVISETKKNISAESLRIMLSSFRWGGYGKPEDGVYDQRRQVAMGKPGVDNKEKARVYILRLWDFAWADPDWKDKEAKREVTTTAAGKRKPSVRVPWQLWLDELLAFVPELDKIRANKAGTAADRGNRRTDDVPAPLGVGADVGDK